MNGTLAPRSDRLIAALIDAGPVILLTLALRAGREGSLVTPLVLVLEIAYLVYQMVLLSNSGQTIGKRMRRLQIQDIRTGQNGGFVTNVVKRTLLNALLSIVPLYALVDIFFIFRADRRCVHDLIAGTHVVSIS